MMPPGGNGMPPYAGSGFGFGGYPNGITPPPPPPAATPMAAAAAAAPTAPAENTPDVITDVRDEITMEICDGTERGEVIQGVLDSLTAPYNQQIVNANALLARKGKSVSERLDGLARMEKNRRDSKKN